MTLYLLTSTHYDGGFCDDAEIRLRGIFSSLEKAENVKKELTKDYFRFNDPKDDYDIQPVKVDQVVEITL